VAPADLVLLHGFTHTGASWDPVVAALGERYRALAPDIRGHGRAADIRPVTLRAVLSDLEAITAQLDTFILGGYSMGGRIALHGALHAPLAHRIIRLVLIGASPGLADADARAARRNEDEALAAQLERSTIEEFAQRWAQMPVLAGQPPEVLAAVQADRVRNTPPGLAAALRGLGTGALPSLWDRLAELELSVKLIAGERDARFIGIAQQMARALPRARIEVVSGAGHAVHLEAPGVVAAQFGER
jgi:2-succinyl-6-hydroxy-2,4-cyclohexadiene-1-carboxylate synthase